jgi:hypothetical protein
MRILRRGQTRIIEMSFMIIAVFLLFIIVGMFFLSIYFSGIQKSAYQGEREKAILLLTKLSQSPELNCIEGGVCVDADKIIGLVDNEKYASFWDVEGLEIVKEYPKEELEECNVGNYPNCNKFNIITPVKTGTIQDSSYVSICRREFKQGYSYKLCELGKIIVYTKK